MPERPQISENSRRIAKNTLALYFRMFVLLVIGLFTARIVLNALGVEDRGVYDAVGSFVAMMAILTNALSSAISRFLTVEIGRGDFGSQRKVFSTAVSLMLMISGVVLLVAEPVGIWYVSNVMNLPDGREFAAQVVFQFSLLTFIVGLLSVPYNAAIIAHEKMTAFAVIGVVEGVLKLCVALTMLVAMTDKLILYAVLMAAAAILTRFMYAMYCRHGFAETRGLQRPDKGCLRQMFGFAGWNGLGQGVYLINTQGVTLLVNYFFGVAFNTMRGIALSVESVVRQFVINVLTAMNPQITKSYVSGNREYSYVLACKGSKYSFLIIFMFAVPFFFEADCILRLWLGDIVPEYTALFTRLTFICMCLDLLMTTFSTLVQATGDIRKFYLVTSLVALVIFPATWILYRLGAPVYTCYLVFIAVYLVNDVVRLFLVCEKTGLPMRMFLRNVIYRVLPVTVISLAVTYLVWSLMDAGWLRLLVVLCTGAASVLATSFAFALSKGEREFVLSRVKRR